MSLADAFAAATALELRAKLVTGADLDFDGVRALQVERV
jgi:predicted nucleic acid-binding protein